MFFLVAEIMLRGNLYGKDALEFRKLMLYTVESRGANKILEESK